MAELERHAPARVRATATAARQPAATVVHIGHPSYALDRCTNQGAEPRFIKLWSSCTSQQQTLSLTLTNEGCKPDRAYLDKRATTGIPRRFLLAFSACIVWLSADGGAKLERYTRNPHNVPFAVSVSEYTLYHEPGTTAFRRRRRRRRRSLLRIVHARGRDSQRDGISTLLRYAGHHMSLICRSCASIYNIFKCIHLFKSMV